MNVVTEQVESWRSTLNHNQQRALALLGQNVSSTMVAGALGVSESLISQYLAEPRFAEEVTRLKLAGLQKQTSVDNKYLEAEDKLLDKLHKVIPLITKPMDILRGLQVVNASKRRGMADGPVGTSVTNIVQINLPASIAARFISNGQNQIVEIQDEQGARSLITSTPQAVDRFAAESIGESTPVANISGQDSSASNLIERASERLAESSVPEVTAAGLRRSYETKARITADDL